MRFNKRERKGVIALAAILAIVTAYVYLGGGTTLSVPDRSSEFELARIKLDSINEHLELLRTRRLFHFDPNVVDSADLDSLGLDARIAKNWLNYRQAGGFFEKAQDIKRVYGMDSSWWNLAKPYMVFGTVNLRPDSATVKASGAELFRFLPDTMKEADWVRLGLSKAQAAAVVKYLSKTNDPVTQEDLDRIYVLDKEFLQRVAPYMVMDTSSTGDSIRTIPIPINLIDAPALSVVTSWPMKKAERLIKYRDKLGGFHSTYQIWETYGLDSTDLMPLEGRWDLERTRLIRMDVNSASLEDLAAHPYLRYKDAKAIVEFRENVRPLRNEAELRELRLMSDKKLAKLAPYLMYVY